MNPRNIRVTLLNPEEVKHFIEGYGKFASVCKPGQEPSEAVAQRIGLFCLRATHTSPTRWAYFKFKVEGISRVCSHQLVRHSVGVALNQQSGVFGETTFNKDTFVTPPSYSGLPAALCEELDAYFEKGAELYSKLRENGLTTSDARYIIPQGSETSLHVGYDFEAMQNLANRRLCTRAQHEIREVVRQMCAEIKKAEPLFDEFFKPMCFRLHGCPESKSCGLYEQATK